MELLYIFSVIVFSSIPLTSSKPIMVSFGTNQGPIIPPISTTTYTPPINERRAPAPVHEEYDDIPNPSTYKPLIPSVYRKNVLSFRPNPNLILGTAQDQKYLGNSNKFYELKRAQARAVGYDYQGPQFFTVQEYELDKLRQLPNPDQLFQPIMQPYAPQQYNQQWNQQSKQVPQIGIVYSSGLRYYIPQIPYPDDQHLQENSVYSSNDVKYNYQDAQNRNY